MITKTRTWALLVLVVGLTAAMFAAGCGSSDSTSTTSSSGGSTTGGGVDLSGVNLLKDGTLTVGSDIPFPPFEQGDPPDYTGFDIDLINAVADKLGLQTSIQDAPFNLLLSGGGGQFDLAIAATTITTERAAKVDFSDPYFDAEQGLLVPDGSDIQTVDDLSGKIVGVQQGTTGQTFATDNTGASEVRPFPQINNAYNALKTGQVDAVINDLPSVQDAADKLGGLQVVQDFPTNEQYGIYAQKGSPIIPAVNEALQQVKDDGTLTDLYQKWFKIDPPKDVLDGGPAKVLSSGG